jgi:hypothetical protein
MPKSFFMGITSQTERRSVRGGQRDGARLVVPDTALRQRPNHRRAYRNLNHGVMVPRPAAGGTRSSSREVDPNRGRSHFGRADCLDNRSVAMLRIAPNCRARQRDEVHLPWSRETDLSGDPGNCAARCDRLGTAAAGRARRRRRWRVRSSLPRPARAEAGGPEPGPPAHGVGSMKERTSRTRL